MLRAAPRRVDLLLDSAVRADAQAALMLVKSWYPGLDVGVLTGLRADSDADVSVAWPAICHRAAKIRSNINPLEYTPYLDDEGAPMPMATFSDLVHRSSSSDANATPDGDCRTTSTSSSGDYANSDLEVEGSASSGPPLSPAAGAQGRNAGPPQPGSTQEPPTAQADPSATAPPSASQPETTELASGGKAAPQAPAA